MFSGSYWSAAKAMEYGLIDGIADLRSKMRPCTAARCACVRCLGGRWIAVALPAAARPRVSAMFHGDGFAMPSLADDLVSAVETRALWSRFGL